MTTSESLIGSQLAYYQARAAEYDATFVPYMDPALPHVLDRLCAGNIKGDVLELASGTGYWTRHLSQLAERVTALDGSAEMIAEAGRHYFPNVDFRLQDLFDWTPERQWDAVFFAHWLAHVPDDRFNTFWTAVRRAVSPRGVVEFVDVTDHERRIEQQDDMEPDVAVRRTLRDGRSFRVVKIFRSPGDLHKRLAGLGWRCRIDEVYPGFLYATCHPTHTRVR